VASQGGWGTGNGEDIKMIKFSSGEKLEDLESD